MKATKLQLCEALRRFINQRSGIEYANYGEREAFMGDYRPMLKRGKQARTLLRAVELRDSIAADDLIAATRAFSGRLQFVENEKGVAVDYTAGQYFPTEYRSAACAVLASALWRYFHGCADAASDGKETAQPGIVAVGDCIRKQAVRELGRGIARDWFN